MSACKDGGPAFPIPPIDRGPGNIKTQPEPGMSLRDWFAGQALPSAIAQMEFKSPADLAGMANTIASACYFIADGMLAARDRA